MKKWQMQLVTMQKDFSKSNSRAIKSNSRAIKLNSRAIKSNSG